MRMIVTGGMGFIGSNFIRHILESRGCTEVIDLDALKLGSNVANLDDLKPDESHTFIKGDITDSGLMSRLVRDADCVVNFAAETHVDRSISNPLSFLQSNVFGVFTILEALRLNNPDARFVQISTDEVYGDIMGGSFRESDAIRPSSPYSASKASSDAFVLAYARTYGLNASITRCTNNFGPYQFPEKLIPKTIIRASMSMKIPIYGSGRNVRDWIYVLDHCRAVENVLDRGEPGEVYNISSGDERANLELVKEILERMGRDETLIQFVEDRPGHDLRYSLNSSRIREELGWRPKYSFDEGMKKTVEWYLENERWWRPLADRNLLDPTPWKLGW